MAVGVTTAIPRRTIFSAFALCVAAFVAANLVAAWRLSDVSTQSKAIWQDTMPGVVALTTLRERLGTLLSGLSDAVENGHRTPPEVDRRLAEIRDEEIAYETRAWGEGQDDAWTRARTSLEAAEGAAGRVRVDLAAGDEANARAVLDSEARPAFATADEALWQMVKRDATQGEQLARRIDRIRRSSVLLLFGLDAACLALAATLTMMAGRILKRHADIVESRSRELELFAARVAHDVRGPLTPIVVAVQRLERQLPQTHPERRHVERAARSLKRVTSLVDDLLDFARAGGAPQRNVRASVLDVAHATVDEAFPLAARDRIALTLDPGAEGLAVSCPQGVLTSVFTNLVQNAIKYMGSSRERRIVVHAERAGACVRAEVRDTGPGLAPDAAEVVFEPYVRADRSGQPGLGLGLATVKRLVEAYGGSVGVRSDAGGSTFWFELPATE